MKANMLSKKIIIFQKSLDKFLNCGIIEHGFSNSHYRLGVLP